jgi:hypothetical protein
MLGPRAVIRSALQPYNIPRCCAQYNVAQAEPANAKLFSPDDHAFLDTLDEAMARIFAPEQGHDLVDDTGMLTEGGAIAG